MCGLVGFATTDPDTKLKAIFTELLVLSSFRGIHSTGVAAIDTADNETELLKVIGNPFNLFERQAYASLSSNFKNVWIGHTRHATRGSVTSWNAHPFEFNHIIGAHNGTILNDYDLRKELQKKFGLESDSQVLFAHLSENGPKVTIPQVRGAYAITYYDKNDEMLYFIKNEERPLWFCYSEDKTIMWWASEWTMLEYILQARNKIELWRDEEGFAFFPVEDDTLYGFKVPREKTYKAGKKDPVTLEIEEELKGAEKYKPLVSTPFSAANEEETVVPPRSRILQGQHRPTPPKVIPPNVRHENSSTPNCTNQCPTEESSKGSRTPKPTLRLVETNRNDSLDDSLLYGPDGQLLFTPEYNKMVSDGCLWCNENVTQEDANHIRWVISAPAKEAEPTCHVLCPACSKSDSEAMENKKWIAGAYGHITEPIVELGAPVKKPKDSKPKKESKSKKATTTVEGKAPKKVAAK